MTTTRAAQIDDALARLASATKRPWDSEDAPKHRLDTPPSERNFLHRWIRSGDDQEAAPGWRRRILDRPALLVAAVLVAGLVAVWLLTAGRPPVPEIPPDIPVAATTQRSAAAPGVVVEVVGKVAAPGLFTLPEGARVADALRAGGGALPGTDLSTLNLARRVADGEQIHVGVPIPAAAVAQTALPGPMDLNTASLIQLDTLPGVGSVTAQRIVEWRSKHGRFTKIDQLREVEGIGQSRFETLRELVTVR
ncbi:Helix-hairpin-helix DNA-binding, class 1 [Alloactinosynnema sp. L-07]|uniref:ComEA family DNA-binding protein n=1 Tax=Alloactinosynnema sp. L-07 TaxID=1653480 RepID=UPI00065F002C|nr:ComEA family DNA-binding protein [Alloactinosynnema sp. L-07]CRK55496.1 Helix-hairpin-helix DNA-binding, class 1 [Alloactinosynnema sp. L-07]